MHPRRPSLRTQRSGIALVVVLFVLMLLVVIVIAFFSNTMTESAGAVAYGDSVTAKQLADSALHLAQGQIRDATRGQVEGGTPETLAWASQPGMIRTYSANGAAKSIYKLYSDDAMVVPAGDFKPDLDTLPATWHEGVSADIYTDLNEPAPDRTGRLDYPIVDPRAEAGFETGAPPGGVEGFKITSRPGYDSQAPASATNNPAPMPVQWLYILRDGAMAAGTANGEVVKVAGATTANPIVGRVAFWTDDETAKVNINTASEGTYWDVPRVYSMEDSGQYQSLGVIGTPGLALCQPAQREFQRYPGHPATTSLSPILGMVLPVTYPVTAATASQLDPYYAIAPRVIGGGSAGGSRIPPAALTADTDRLYASVDELIFTPGLSGDARIPNASTDPKPGVITREVIEKTKFFLTASSNAPETTLFNTPRVAIWPVNTAPSKRTAYDKLAAFCSTVGGKDYYFTRANPRSSTADYAGRNVELYQYLQALTGRNIPGFGGNFLAKYPAGSNGISDRDQILTSIYDYIRCTSIQDRSAGATSYTPIFSNSALGGGEVIPIKIGATQGFGRFYSISQANLLFHGTRTTSGKVDRMRAVFILEFASPMQGLGAMRSSVKYVVKGLDKLQAKFGAEQWKSLEFKPGGTNFMDTSDLSTYHGRSVGGTEGPTQALINKTSALPSPPYVSGTKGWLDTDAGGAVHNKYPFFSAADVTVPATLTTFQFKSDNSEVIVEIRTADSDQLVQEVRLNFPDGEFKIPGIAGASPHNFGSRNIGDTKQMVNGTDTVVGLLPAGALGNDPAPGPDGTAGDTRMIEALPVVPASRFRAHNDYKTKGVQFAHGFVMATGEPFPGGKYGKLVPVPDPSYKQTNSYNYRQPDVPSRVGSAVTRVDLGPGDWDTGFGDQKDGAYINKPDEGDTALTDVQGGHYRLPYLLGFAQGFAAATSTYFSPNRQIPSALMFGSIPTGVQRLRPWQTLLFHPRPEDATHPGKASPPDHLIADLFWMPIIEPYAISQPFSTSGKININYEIQPFTYIRRDTGLRAVMKSTKFMALQLNDAQTYKPIDPGNSSVRLGNRRYAIDPVPTLAAFDAKFANKEIFKSATQICEMNLVPPGQTQAGMAAYWQGNRLTGDNLREKPYVDIYPRLTTKSNTYTVHVRVQVLKKSRATPPSQWIHGKDSVSAEYRGSSIVERYIDMNDPTLPDFGKLSATNPGSTALNIDRYYRMRVISTKRFNR